MPKYWHMGESEVCILKNTLSQLEIDPKEQILLHDTAHPDVPYVRIPVGITDVLVLHPYGWFIEGEYPNED